MSRSIIDIPRFMLMVTAVDWDIDWRGQSAGEANDGSEQVVYNAFPRFIGSPSVILPEPMIGIWRAIRARVQGRVNAYRVPMIDPVSVNMAGRSWRNDLRAYERGQYQPVVPTVRCVSAVSAGASSIVVDETLAHEPVRVGAYLSYNDWPFMVTGRSGSGAAVTLSVTMLRTAISANANIALAASGLFLATSDTMGNPSYGVNRVARFDLDFKEWINR